MLSGTVFILVKTQTGAIGLREVKKLPTLENPEDADVYQVAKNQLHKRCGRKTNVALERFKFYSRAQQENESIDQFVVALRGLAVSCKFENMLYDQVLRGQLLIQTKSKKILEKLCSCDEANLKSALDAARSIEESEKCIHTVRNGSRNNNAEPVNAIMTVKESKEKGENIDVKKSGKKLCYRCGSGEHLANSKVFLLWGRFVVPVNNQAISAEFAQG